MTSTLGECRRPPALTAPNEKRISARRQSGMPWAAPRIAYDADISQRQTEIERSKLAAASQVPSGEKAMP